MTTSIPNPGEVSEKTPSLFECPADQQARRDSQGHAVVRFGVGFVFAVLRMLALPYWFPKTLLRERSLRSNATQKASEVDPTDVQVASEHCPIVVLPLADMERYGVPVPRSASKFFVLLAPVTYELSDTLPVGASTDPSFGVMQIPGQPGLQQVPCAFVTDFASIPTPIQMLTRPAGRYGRAAVFHDWAYSYHHNGTSRGRKACDVAMLNMMRRDGVGAWLRTALYIGLRIGGGMAYRSAPKRRKKIRPYAKKMLLPFVNVQAYVLAYLARQFQDAQQAAAACTPAQTSVRATAQGVALLQPDFVRTPTGA